jgi:hypothetical protein
MFPGSCWLRFSLRTALVLRAVVCVPPATLGRRAQRMLAQKRAVEATWPAGGRVIADSEDRDVGPFSAPTWKVAFGLAPSPRVTRASFASSSDEPDIRQALPRPAALTDLEEVEVRNLAIEFDFNDGRAAGLRPLDDLVERWLDGGESLTAAGFSDPLRRKLRVLWPGGRGGYLGEGDGDPWNCKGRSKVSRESSWLCGDSSVRPRGLATSEGG